MRDYAQGVRGHVRMLANASALIESLVEGIANLTRLHPDIRIAEEEAHSENVPITVRDGKADFGVFAPPVTSTGGLQVLPYHENRLALAVSEGHELASRRSATFLRSFSATC